MDFQAAYEMKKMQRELLDKCNIASSCIDFMLESDKKKQVKILSNTNLVEQVYKIKNSFPDIYNTFQFMSTPLNSWIPLKKEYLFPTQEQISKNILFPGANVFINVKEMRQKGIIQRCVFKLSASRKSHGFVYEVASIENSKQQKETEKSSYVYLSWHPGPKVYSNVRNTDITPYSTLERDEAISKMARGKISMFLKTRLRKQKQKNEPQITGTKDETKIHKKKKNKKQKQTPSF